MSTAWAISLSSHEYLLDASFPLPYDTLVATCVGKLCVYLVTCPLWAAFMLLPSAGAFTCGVSEKTAQVNKKSVTLSQLKTLKGVDNIMSSSNVTFSSSEFISRHLWGMGSLFYVVKPSETTFEKVEDLPHPDWITKVRARSFSVCPLLEKKTSHDRERERSRPLRS